MKYQNLILHYERIVDALVYWLSNNPDNHPEYWLNNQMKNYYIRQLILLEEHEYHY